jgi:hypothetical protein
MSYCVNESPSQKYNLSTRFHFRNRKYFVGFNVLTAIDMNLLGYGVV